MAYDFVRASAQYLSVASTPVTSAPITLSCWVNPDDVANVQDLLFVSDNNAVTDGFGIRIEPVSDQFQAVTISSDTVIVAQGSTVISPGTWYHVCGVFASSTSRIIYVNGANVGSNATSATPSGITHTHFGVRTTGDNEYFDGRGAELAIWSAALDDSEVAALAKGMSPVLVRSTSLEFYAPLVREIIDRVGGRTFSNTGGATVSAHPRVYYPHRRFIQGKVAAGTTGEAALTGSSHTAQQTAPSVVFNVPL